MGDSFKLRDVVEQAVAAVIHEHLDSLKSDIVDRACRELKDMLPAAAPATPAGGSPTDLLNAAFCSVLDCATQAEILSALLAGATKFSSRAALFVIRGGAAVGWQGTGFSDDEQVKSASIAVDKGLAARAVQDRLPAAADAAEFDSAFISTVGAPAEGTNVLVLPLVMRDKVAAFLYADAGSSGMLDSSALECLVRSAGLWLEIVAARKAQADVPTGSDKIRAMVEPVAPPPPAPVVASEPPPPPPGISAASAAAAAVAPAPAAISADDEEVHKKAKRFAKLLVDEIKLYNQAKVVEGRARRDLYQRLKDDIDKSRASYDKRYGQTCAASANYFIEELIRILCDGNESLLGGGFSR